MPKDIDGVIYSKRNNEQITSSVNNFLISLLQITPSTPQELIPISLINETGIKPLNFIATNCQIYLCFS